MFELIRKVCFDIFSDRLNLFYCPVRILGAASLIDYLLLSHLEMMKHASQFSLNETATGICMILGIISAGVSLKNKSEQ